MTWQMQTNAEKNIWHLPPSPRIQICRRINMYFSNESHTICYRFISFDTHPSITQTKLMHNTKSTVKISMKTVFCFGFGCRWFKNHRFSYSDDDLIFMSVNMAVDSCAYIVFSNLIVDTEWNPIKNTAQTIQCVEENANTRKRTREKTNKIFDIEFIGWVLQPIKTIASSLPLHTRRTGTHIEQRENGFARTIFTIR